MRTTPQPFLDATKLVPELGALRKTTVRLHPRRGNVAEPGASKLGGPFLWPASEPWPACERHGLPLVCILQLRKSDVPELGFRPGTDLFQLLWCPQDHDSEPSVIVAPRIFWRKASTIREPLARIPQPRSRDRNDAKHDEDLEHTRNQIEWLKCFVSNPEYLKTMLQGSARDRKEMQKDLELPFFEPCPPSKLRQLQAVMRQRLAELQGLDRAPTFAEDRYVPIPCRLFPERVAELPSLVELPPKVARKLAGEWELPATKELQERRKEYLRLGEIGTDDEFVTNLYQRELSVADGTKVGGYVAWVQGPEVPKCRCGRKMEHLLTIACSECHAANWRRWLAKEDRQIWAKPWRTSEKVIGAPGIMLGDVGKLYLFICRHCKDWPLRSVFQCS